MDNLANTIQNNALAQVAHKAPDNVLKAIKKASLKTGVNFAYMVQQASAESSFDPKAKAKGSSAAGLYQFIESTWLSMVKKYGEKYGMGDYADKINAKGKVTDKALRKEILALRNDPEKASALAAEFASDNEQFLQTHWAQGQREIGPTELYFAHFLGAGQAAAFLKARDEDPMQQAALLFPKAAKANRNVFYDTATGRPKTLDEVYAFFDKKFDVKMPETPVLVAEAAPVPPQRPPAPQSSVFVAQHTSGGYNSLYSAMGYRSLVQDPIQLMLLAQLDLPIGDKKSIF